MSPQTDIGRYLPIYLNDHLAGATAGVELARRIEGGNQEIAALAPVLRRVRAEIEADRETLEGVLDRLAVSRSPIKPYAAWLVERLGRLKPNGHLRAGGRRLRCARGSGGRAAGGDRRAPQGRGRRDRHSYGADRRLSAGALRARRAPGPVAR